MTPLEFVVVSLAVFRVSRLIVSDSILDRVRIRFLTRHPASDTVFMDGGDGRLWVEALDGWVAEQPSFFGELISCVWCVGFWVAVLAVIGWWQVPQVVWWIGLPFALSAVAGIVEEVTQ